MKLWKTFAIILGLTFVVGLSLASLFTQDATAGEPCVHACTYTRCLGNGQCSQGYVEKWRFWQDEIECLGIACDSAFIGCTLPC